VAGLKQTVFKHVVHGFAARQRRVALVAAEGRAHVADVQRERALLEVRRYGDSVQRAQLGRD
jgi:hypothetical protein